jgi:hypothetical protein
MPCIYHQVGSSSINNNHFTFDLKTTEHQLYNSLTRQSVLKPRLALDTSFLLRYSETKSLDYTGYIGIIPNCSAIAYNSIEPRSISVGPQPKRHPLVTISTCFYPIGYLFRHTRKYPSNRILMAIQMEADGAKRTEHRSVGRDQRSSERLRNT